MSTINLPVVSSDSSFYRYLREINQIPSLSAEEEFLLAKNYLENEDLQAAHKLVTSHLKLVAKIAMGFRGYGLPVSELVSEGNIGLMKAIKKYDPDLGFRLSTYAMWWVKASIQEYILKSWSLVKIGTTAAQKKLFFSLGKIKARIQHLHARSINNEDYKQIANDLGVSERDVIEMNQRLSCGDISLNSPYGDQDDSGELEHYIPEIAPNQEVLYSQQEDYSQKKQLLSTGLKILNARELDVISQRKLQDLPATLDDLSIKYNVSKERIRQIENRAFEKLQSYMIANSK